jgi:hypothetical protein
VRFPARFAALTSSLGAAATVIAFSATQTVASHRSDCLPRGAQTIAADHSVRVYTLRQRHAQLPIGSYACLFRTGKTVPLVKSQPGPGHLPFAALTHAALAGTIVAFAAVQHGVDSGCFSITVLDVPTKRTLISIAQAACYVDAGFVKAGRVSDLVVSARGEIAWISTKGRNGAETFEVRTAALGNSSTLLDEGAEIASGSLRLTSRGEVSWINGGRTRYAKLP